MTDEKEVSARAEGYAAGRRGSFDDEAVRELLEEIALHSKDFALSSKYVGLWDAYKRVRESEGK